MKITKEEKIKYLLAHPEMSYEELGKELGMKAEGVRNFCKRNKLPNKRNNIQATRTGENLAEMVAKVVANKRVNVIDLANTFNVAPKQINQALDELKAKNIILDVFTDASIQLAKEIPVVDAPFTLDTKKFKEKEFAIGFTADNHIGNKKERLDVLNALYDKFAEYGIETVYNGGNYIDGECRFNQHEIYVHGVEDQLDNFLVKYPQRKGMTTYFVSGDDHEGWYVQREHINIGELLVDKAHRIGRNDLVNLGYMERDIEFKTEKGSSILRVIHAGGGSSYATSYSAQKYVESLQGGEKPSIILCGHYHKFDYSYPREVHFVQGGCTVDQTNFMRKKKIQGHVGGVVLWLRQNELGVFTSVRIEWLPFYNAKYYKDYWF